MGEYARCCSRTSGPGENRWPVAAVVWRRYLGAEVRTGNVELDAGGTLEVRPGAAAGRFARPVRHGHGRRHVRRFARREKKIRKIRKKNPRSDRTPDEVISSTVGI